MTAGRYDIRCEQGAALGEVFTYYADAAMTTVVVLTGFEALLVVRTRPGRNADELTRATTADGRISINGAAGEITVSIPATITDEFEDGDYWYTLTIWPAGNEAAAERLLEGDFCVSPGESVG